MAENTQEQQSETTCITDTQVSQIVENLILIKEKCANLSGVIDRIEKDWLRDVRSRLDALSHVPEDSNDILAIVRKLENLPAEYAEAKAKIERLSTEALNLSKLLTIENQHHEKQAQSIALIDTRLKELYTNIEQWRASNQSQHSEQQQTLRLIDSSSRSVGSVAAEVSAVKELLRKEHETLHHEMDVIEKQAELTRSLLTELQRDALQRFEQQSASTLQFHEAMSAMSRGLDQSTQQNEASHRETRDRLNQLQQTINPVAVISDQLSDLPVKITALDTTIQSTISKLRADVDTIIHRELAGGVERMNANVVDSFGNIAKAISALKSDMMNFGSGVENRLDERLNATIKGPSFEVKWISTEKLFMYVLPFVLASLAVWWMLSINREINMGLSKQNGEKWQQEINRQADKEKALNEKEHSCREDYYKEKERANRLEFELSSLRNKQREQKPLSGPVRSGPVPASPAVKSDGRGGSMTFSGTLHLAPAASPARQDAPATGEGTSSTPSVPGKPVKPAAPSGKTGT